ncbi:hypothetical protein [Aurantimonas aggregata]|uniref:hypothetical protein n=1 Tax=Aurantimonas aggregata TaxID=2047720 RepID=UPI001943CB96|nr:hypothetical protein [Aurantimonas aggregata]
MHVSISDVKVISISRVPLILLLLGCVAIGVGIFFGAFMRGSGVFGRMLFDPTTDAMLLGIVGLGMIALPVFRLRELIVGYSATLSVGGVRAVYSFSDRFIGWKDIVSVEVPPTGDRVTLLQWHPSRSQRLWTTRSSIIISLRHTQWSVRDLLLAMIELHPPLKAKIGPDVQSRHL